MDIPSNEHPYRLELLRAQQLSATHDEMKWIINHLIVPEFKDLIQTFIKHSYPWDIKVHGHGVIFNFGKPSKRFTIAYCGYAEDLEFELAITADAIEAELEIDIVELDTPSSQGDDGLDEYFNSKSEPSADDLIDFGIDEFIRRQSLSSDSQSDQLLVNQAVEQGEVGTQRLKFTQISPVSIRRTFEKFLTQHVPELDYEIAYKSYEIHDACHQGPYQLRIQDEDATSVIATESDFDKMLAMASMLIKTFRGKDLIITEEDGSLVC